MIEKCPECKEKIDILQIQEPNPESTTNNTFAFTQTTTTIGFPTYPPTSKIYKCSNPKCWVTKITESWD